MVLVAPARQLLALFLDGLSEILRLFDLSPRFSLSFDPFLTPFTPMEV